MTVKVFDFFSGCGGNSAGLREARLGTARTDIVLGLDVDPDAARTFQANFPRSNFIQKDIRSVTEAELEPLVQACKGHPLLFAGCAPCQPFSARNRVRNTKKDGRVNLLREFGRFVEHFLPDYVLVENVPGIQQVSMDTPGPLEEFVTLLGRLGYHHCARVIRSQDYGVPQRRARLVLIASRHGPIGLPEVTHGPKGALGMTKLRPYATAWDAIKHLPPLQAGEKHPYIPNHECHRLTEINLRRMRVTPEGGDRRNWPEELWLDCHKGRNGEGRFKGHMDVYGRIRKDQPASGLTTRCISLSHGRFGHPDPEQHRALSVREAAHLQTFPPNFVFYGSTMSTARQVGNAVPVLLAKCLGEQILKHASVHGLRTTPTLSEIRRMLPAHTRASTRSRMQRPTVSRQDRSERTRSRSRLKNASARAKGRP